MATQETITIPAVYEGGVLRPLEPLDLPEHTRVQVTVAVVDDQFKAEDERIRAILSAGGVQLVPRPTNSRQPMTEEERAALMREIGPGVNASGAIIEERESGW
jgi:predicted DNA-binding antitoxin AbrB/MazE fold protein